MSASITVSVRSLLVGVVTTTAVGASYLVGSTQAGSPRAYAAEDPAAPENSSIVMTGSGEAHGVPDELAFSMSVNTNATDVSTALTQANHVTRRVLRAVHDQGIASRDVQTTGLSIHPNYDYSGEGPAVITGYGVSQRLSVLVRTLSDGGATISAAVSAGGNAVRLSGVHLQIADTDDLMRRARAAAFAEARAKAEEYAQASGRQLGAVTSVREVSAHQPEGVALGRVAAAMDQLSSVPIRAGSADLRVIVSVVWSFA